MLIDSQVLVWILFGYRRLGEEAIVALESASEVQVSMASYWELAIKFAKGLFEHSPSDLMLGVGGSGFGELEIGHRHIVKLPFVTLPHRDPFDAILVAQAEADGLTLVTADRTLLASPYATLDARA